MLRGGGRVGPRSRPGVGPPTAGKTGPLPPGPADLVIVHLPVIIILYLGLPVRIESKGGGRGSAGRGDDFRFGNRKLLPRVLLRCVFLSRYISFTGNTFCVFYLNLLSSPSA